jgi:DsbC/DsbD-like thiol-disulfide interchange protein
MGVVGIGAGVLAAGEGRKKPSDVQASLLADTTAVKAGESFLVAIVLEPNKDWHIYWKNPGDSGMATKFSLSVPAGFTAEMLDFPMPMEFTQPGDLVAYGYAGRTVFLARITAPKELAANQKVTVGVDASWLSCKDVCVPGGKKLSLELAVAGENQSAANKELFEKAQADVPAAAAPAEVVSAITPEAKLDPTGGKGSFGLRIRWKKEVQDVAAFPLAVEGVEVSGLKVESQKDQSRVSFDARVLTGQTLKEKTLSVLVTYKDAAGKRQGYYSDVDLSALADGTAK